MTVQVADAVQAFAVSLTRRRFAAGAYSTTTGSKGVFVAGTATDTTIRGTIGPVNGRTREAMPEGIRARARYLLHTTADVRGDQPTATGTAITQADRLVYRGQEFEVYQDRRWEDHGGYRRLVLLSATAEP